MVRKEGQEEGVAIWEIDNIHTIEDRIKQRIESFDYPFELETIYVIGSYGSGMGVPNKSDLDVVVSGVFNGVLSPSELSNMQGKLAEHIMDGDIIDDYSEFTALDLYVDDPAHFEDATKTYASFEPVETYYDLLNEETIEYSF